MKYIHSLISITIVISVFLNLFSCNSRYSSLTCKKKSIDSLNISLNKCHILDSQVIEILDVLFEDGEKYIKNFPETLTPAFVDLSIVYSKNNDIKILAVYQFEYIFRFRIMRIDSSMLKLGLKEVNHEGYGAFYYKNVLIRIDGGYQDLLETFFLKTNDIICFKYYGCVDKNDNWIEYIYPQLYIDSKEKIVKEKYFDPKLYPFEK